jgi:NRPS condensation-like uncharacterized protein
MTTRYSRFSMVDELNCYHDSPSEPNSVHLEVWLPGHLSPERLAAAVAATLADLPRARGRRARSSWWRTGYTWEFPSEPDVDPVSVTVWRTERELSHARARFLAVSPALDRSPPFRLLLARGTEWDSLILNAHHAAFDGHSCLRLLRAIADHYGTADPPSATGYSGPGPAPSGPDRTGPPPPSGSWFTAREPWGAAWRAARISPQRADHRRGHRLPGYGVALLEWPGVPAVSQPRDRAPATVNDLLIAALVQTIAAWNAERHRGTARPRITMPVDMRRPGHSGDLGNLSRLSTISVDLARTADLAAAVADQTRQAKQRPGPQVSPGLSALTRLPLPAMVKRWLLRGAVHSVGRLVADSCLLTNLGRVPDPPAFGMGPSIRMWFSGPANMPRGLSVGAITVDGRLRLCFRYRNALFDQAAAEDFAAEYAKALSALAAKEHA